ncbi:MAG: hypothetical protein N3E46_10395 [Gemmataceae bacterium]|nr:hypothetical protein [Gemmataceae bacterium]
MIHPRRQPHFLPFSAGANGAHVDLRLGFRRIGVLDHPLRDDLLSLPLQSRQTYTRRRRVNEHLEVRKRAGQIRGHLPTLHILLDHDEPIQPVFLGVKGEMVLIWRDRRFLIPGILSIAGDE